LIKSKLNSYRYSIQSHVRRRRMCVCFCNNLQVTAGQTVKCLVCCSGTNKAVLCCSGTNKAVLSDDATSGAEENHRQITTEVAPTICHSFFRRDENTRLCNTATASLLLPYLLRQHTRRNHRHVVTCRCLIIAHSLLDATYIWAFQELHCHTSSIVLYLP
jgi:hypothetical protein